MCPFWVHSYAWVQPQESGYDNYTTEEIYYFLYKMNGTTFKRPKGYNGQMIGILEKYNFFLLTQTGYLINSQKIFLVWLS